jgi:hypothetical protein
MTNTYNSVIIIKFNDRLSRYICNTEAGYRKYLKDEPDMAEVIGEYKQQIKPTLDVDAYIKDIDVSEVISDIDKIFPDKPVKCAKREPRETKKGLKYSYRFYVQDVRITSKNLKNLLVKNEFDQNEIYDMSIYYKNKILFLPLTTKKVGCDVPSLLIALYLNAVPHILKKNLKIGILKIPKESVKEEVKSSSVLCDSDEVAYDGKLNFNDIMTKFKQTKSN